LDPIHEFQTAADGATVEDSAEAAASSDEEESVMRCGPIRPTPDQFQAEQAEVEEQEVLLRVSYSAACR